MLFRHTNSPYDPLVPWWPDPRDHLYVVGPSGSGKSTCLFNLMHGITTGLYGERGFCFVDPHGDTAREDVLISIPRDQVARAIWFDPTDRTRPFGINLVPYAPDNPLEAEHTTEAFASIWQLDRDVERFLKHVLILHSYVRDSTLFECLKIFHNDSYLKEAVRRCGNPVTRRFWQQEFPLWALTPRFKADRVDPVVAMFETLLQHEALQRIFSQSRSTIDFRQIMDRGQYFICSLAHGKLGDQASRLLGAILLSKFRSAAYSRADMPYAERRPFTLIVDEFHELTRGEAGGRVLQSLFSGARKFGLNLCVAHQGSYQDELTSKAAMSNCNTKIAFAVNTPELERGFRTMEWRETNFAARQLWVKVGEDEVFSGESCGKLLPTFEERLVGYARPEQIIDLSQERFGRDGEQVAREVARRL